MFGKHACTYGRCCLSVVNDWGMRQINPDLLPPRKELLPFIFAAPVFDALKGQISTPNCFLTENYRPSDLEWAMHEWIPYCSLHAIAIQNCLVNNDKKYEKNKNNLHRKIIDWNIAAVFFKGSDTKKNDSNQTLEASNWQKNVGEKKYHHGWREMRSDSQFPHFKKNPIQTMTNEYSARVVVYYRIVCDMNDGYGQQHRFIGTD